MAFISFEQIPHDGPVEARTAPAVQPHPEPIARPNSGGGLGWIAAIGLPAIIGYRIASSVGSPALGVVGAGLAFLIGVALTAITRDAPRRGSR